MRKAPHPSILPHVFLLTLLSLVPARANAADPDDNRAVAACQKHVESMLHESTGPRYDDGLRIERIGDTTMKVSGVVTSTSRSGQVFRGGFRCEATRFGVLWTTRMELAVQ